MATRLRKKMAILRFLMTTSSALDFYVLNKYVKIRGAMERARDGVGRRCGNVTSTVSIPCQNPKSRSWPLEETARDGAGGCASLFLFGPPRNTFMAYTSVENNMDTDERPEGVELRKISGHTHRGRCGSSKNFVVSLSLIWEGGVRRKNFLVSLRGEGCGIRKNFSLWERGKGFRKT
jgi:hypothetical protein